LFGLKATGLSIKTASFSREALTEDETFVEEAGGCLLKIELKRWKKGGKCEKISDRLSGEAAPPVGHWLRLKIA